MIAKTKKNKNMRNSGYLVPKGDGTDYYTNSIVKARAYAIKMIRSHEIYHGSPAKRSWAWDIYPMKSNRVTRYKPMSTVVYRPKTQKFVWYHQTTAGDTHMKATEIYIDGRIKR